MLTAVVAVDRRLLAVRAGMTRGQRWTAALGLGLSVVIILFGLPTAVVDVLPDRITAPNQPTSAAQAPAAQSDTVVPTAPARRGPPPLAPSPSAGSREPAATPVDTEVRQPAPSRPDDLIALVRSDATIPGRGDRTIAEAFLGDSRLQATIVELDPTDDGLCAEVADTADIVVTGSGLGPSLRACLVERGVTLLSHDGAGDRRPNGPGGGQVISSRRGVTHSLLDLAAWGSASGALDGKVGLVAAQDLRPSIEPAAEGIRRRGVELVAVQYIEPGSAGQAAMTVAVREFAGVGVEVVIFALPVDQQREWLARAALLHPSARYVVSDAAGPFTDEVYPTSFDGALAHTSFRVPWFARDHEETPEQVSCRQRWQSSARVSLGTAELVQVFAWCQHVALLEAALKSTGEAPLAERLRTVRLPSPLTSDLGPLPDGGYGPRGDAVLMWEAGCSCWTEQRGFEPRQGG